MGRTWSSGLVGEMLARTDAAASRPDGLAEEFGYSVEGYRLSDAKRKRFWNCACNA